MLESAHMAGIAAALSRKDVLRLGAGFCCRSAVLAGMRSALMTALLPGEPTEVAIASHWAAYCCLEAGWYDETIELARLAVGALKKWGQQVERDLPLLRTSVGRVVS